MGWHTPDSAREQWYGAPLDDDIIAEVLEVARITVLAFAPDIGMNAAVNSPPVNYRMAQLLQAQNIWNAAFSNSNGEMGSGEFTIAPRPLDWHVRTMLRPPGGKPVIA